MVFADFLEIFASFEGFVDYLRLRFQIAIELSETLNRITISQSLWLSIDAHKTLAGFEAVILNGLFIISPESNQFHATVPLFFMLGNPFLIFLYHAINACEKKFRKLLGRLIGEVSIDTASERQRICESAGNCQRDTKHNNE